MPVAHNGCSNGHLFYTSKTKTMKQQLNLTIGNAKKISRSDMKKLSGGWWGWYYGLQGTWVCPADGYSCYSQSTECSAACSGACSFSGWCP
jgi:hypothetical protein